VAADQGVEVTLENARALEAAATPGPWNVEVDYGYQKKNAELISHMRNAYPLALDVIEAAKALYESIWNDFDQGGCEERLKTALDAFEALS
jgi:hypothetical protein